MSLNQARKLLQKKDIKGAIEIYDKIKPQFNNDAEFWLEYAYAAASGSFTKHAESCVAQSLKIKPNNHAAYYTLGLVKKLANEHQQAVNSFKTAYDLNPDFNYGANLADVYISNQNFEECLKFLDELETIASNNEENTKVVFLKGNILFNLGKTKEGLALYEKCLNEKTHNFRLFRDYVSAKRIAESDKEIIDYYESLTDTVRGNEEYIEDLYMGLGKAYDDLKIYDKAAANFIKGKQLISRKRPYNRDRIAGISAKNTEIFTRELVKSKQVKIETNVTPIFVVGMPRSGTTLLEQILSTNKDTHGCGELGAIAHIARRSAISIKDRGTIKYPDNVSMLPIEFFQYGAEFYQQTLRSLNPNAKYYVDKMPANINYLGLIKIMLPNAKIIHQKRDLREVALSIFCTNFKDSGLQYSNNFDDLLFFIEEYLVIQKHWKTTMPDEFIEIFYSDLIDNFDEATRKVFNYCDLDWSEDSKNFYQKENTVNTASRNQVRQPIYKSSKEKWKNYEKYFGDFFSRVQQLSEKYEYLPRN